MTARTKWLIVGAIAVALGAAYYFGDSEVKGKVGETVFELVGWAKGLL